MRKNIQALSKASSTIAGEHSGLTRTAREKEADIWENVRDIIGRLQAIDPVF